MVVTPINLTIKREDLVINMVFLEDQIPYMLVVRTIPEGMVLSFI